MVAGQFVRPEVYLGWPATGPGSHERTFSADAPTSCVCAAAPTAGCDTDPARSLFSFLSFVLCAGCVEWSPVPSGGLFGGLLVRRYVQSVFRLGAVCSAVEFCGRCWLNLFLTVCLVLFQAASHRWTWFPTCTGSRPSCSPAGGSVGSVGIDEWLCGDRRLSARRRTRWNGSENPAASQGSTFPRTSGISI